MSKGVKIGIGVFFVIAAIVAIIFLLQSNTEVSGILSIGNRPGAKKET